MTRAIEAVRCGVVCTDMFENSRVAVVVVVVGHHSSGCRGRLGGEARACVSDVFGTPKNSKKNGEKCAESRKKGVLL